MLNIQENVPLSKFTTFRIGGPAKFFVVVSNEAELLEALKYAENQGLDFFVMGGGSNVLVSDQGFNGLVIKLSNAEFLIDGLSVEAGAGVPLAKLVRETGAKGLAGVEWAAGIPGTVGGAVRGNAGAFSRTTGESVKSVRVYDVAEKKVEDYSASDCAFGYRDSHFKHDKKLIILSVKFEFTLGSQEELEQKSREIIQKRVSIHPHGMGSAGSFFMNPTVENQELIQEFENQKQTKARGNKLPAGWVIEYAGLKGKKMGGAIISETHGDFILNTGGATASDVIMLESFVKQQVRDRFGVQLQREVEYIGF
ncbi:UDP-N-acetylmuramate dehydrogenase [Patescibacteria group bacterium]|nr:MAG: UDP-N-acetylmuramate dehydrogenase [Patescibacteria group bacterium]